MTRSVARLAVALLAALTAACHPAPPEPPRAADLDRQISTTLEGLRAVEQAVADAFSGGGAAEPPAQRYPEPYERAFTRTRAELLRLARINRQASLRVIAGVTALRQLDIFYRNDEILEPVCNASDPGLVWPCVQARARLTPAALPRLYALPVLSYRDAVELAGLDVDGLLPGLRCRDVTTWTATLDTLDPEEPSTVHASLPGLYERLSSGAPAASRLCFLEQAARACLRLVHDHRDCLAPYSVGDYFAAAAADQRNVLLSRVFRERDHDFGVYLDLYRNYPEIVFHLHLALAEALGGHSRADVFSRAFHVNAAFKLWGLVNRDSEIAFSEMLSDSLHDHACAEGCRSTCLAESTRDDGDCFAACTNEPGLCEPSRRPPLIAEGGQRENYERRLGTLRVAAFTASAAGIALAGAGIVVGVTGARNERQRQLEIATIVGGSALMTTGVVLFLLSRPDDPTRRDRSLTIVPTASGFTVAGRF